VVFCDVSDRDQSVRVPITTNKPRGNRELAMPAADQLQDPFIDLPESALFEIYRSEISLHRTKAGYGYPTIRLPHTSQN
jgi:hypothetical protein